MKYPEQSSGHVAGSDTSEAAAAHVDASGAADGQLDHVSVLLCHWGTRGGTADELRRAMKDDWPFLHNSIVSARLSRLVNLGLAVKTGAQRKAETGRMQRVYIHADYASPNDIKPIKEAAPKDGFLKEIDPVLRAMLRVLEAGKVARIEPGGPVHKLLKGRYL